MKHLLIAAFASIVLTAPAAGQDAERQLNTTIRKSLAERGDIVSAADRRAIRAKCGLPADANASDNISFSNGGLRCPDGRVVRDAETRAMADRISVRVKAYVAATMKDPAVTAAIAAVADEASRKALRELRQDRR